MHRKPSGGMDDLIDDNIAKETQQGTGLFPGI